MENEKKIEKKIKFYKFFLVGDKGSGKTTLIYSFLNKEPPKEAYKNGTDRLRREFEYSNKAYVVSTWDPTVNELFINSASAYYLLSDVIFIVYKNDLKNKEEEINICFWLNVIKKHGAHNSVIFIKNDPNCKKLKMDTIGILDYKFCLFTSNVSDNQQALQIFSYAMYFKDLRYYIFKHDQLCKKYKNLKIKYDSNMNLNKNCIDNSKDDDIITYDIELLLKKIDKLSINSNDKNYYKCMTIDRYLMISINHIKIIPNNYFEGSTIDKFMI